MKTFTILTLGSTGVGKSTFINSIPNYLIYETLKNAIDDDDPKCIIPIKFTQQIKNRKSIEIKFNGRTNYDVNNECFEEAKSCTIAPRVHSFVKGDVQINIMDVPGIGDTGGLEIDKRNKAAVMERLKGFDKIHAIWVFLKESDTRLNTEFVFALNDVFTVVPKSAIKNIAFVITNSRGSDYTRGHTDTPLKAFISDLNKKQNLNINIDECSYCVDSESFRYQIGYHTNSDFRDAVKKLRSNYETSWEESRTALFKLLETTMKLEGQNTENFLTIHEARIAINCFFTTSAKILSIIEKSADQNFVEEEKKALMDGFKIENDIEIAKTKAPQTVCASKKCMKWQIFPNGIKILQSTQVCHDECYLKQVKLCKTKQNALTECEIFDFQNNCRKCGCSYTDHMHVWYNLHTIIRKIQLQQKMTNSEIELYINSRLEKLKLQKTEIFNAIYIAYQYLQQNSIYPFNDKFDEKLAKEIENHKISTENSADIVKNLETLLQNHQNMMKELEKFKNVTSQNTIIVSDKEFKITLEKIFKMPPYGPKIQELYNIEMNSVNLEAPDFKPIKVNYIPVNQ